MDKLKLARSALSVLTALALSAACIALAPERDSSEVTRWKQQAVQLRELDFVQPVRFERLNSKDIAEVVRGELEASITPEFMEKYRDAYAALGFLPPEIDLLRTMQSLYESEIAGLYSTRRRTMFVLEELDDAHTATEDSTVIHELVHSLQHQHFGNTLELMQALRHNDDVVTAVGAVVEGDASFTMLGANPASTYDRSLTSATHLRDAMLMSLVSPQGMMAQVPNLLRSSLIFPYAHGTVFSARQYKKAGNAGLDRALVDGPLATRQVRFPDQAAPVEFIRLPHKAIRKRISSRGCRIGENNVAGALSIRVLFEEHGLASDLDPIVREWTGDRFKHIDCKETWEFIWLTRWADANAAARFARRYGKIATRIGEHSRLSGTPRVLVSQRNALVLTPGLLDLATLVQSESEIRSYSSLSEWIAGDCFPESPCPKLGN